MQVSALLPLLQLASPSLPVGAYTYSQGLESAIERGVVKDEFSARKWITESLGIVGDFEAPILWRLLKAFFCSRHGGRDPLDRIVRCLTGYCRVPCGDNTDGIFVA